MSSWPSNSTCPTGDTVTWTPWLRKDICSKTYKGMKLINIRVYAVNSIVVPSLRNNREMGSYARPVSGQQLSKHDPAATIMHAMEETGCFCMVHSEMLKARDKVSWQAGLYGSL